MNWPVSDEQVEAAFTILHDDAAFVATASDISEPVAFALKSTDSDVTVCFEIAAGRIERQGNPQVQPHFALVARAEHWQNFFAAVPKRPYQSFWGMLRVLGKGAGVEVTGNVQTFTKSARLWRIILDRLREAGHPAQATLSREEYTPEDEIDDDSIIGHYTWLMLPPLGKCKVFYEVAGEGPQVILFLHTAGADSRQYHSMMQNKALQSKCKMYAFDLPGHGRSFPGQRQYPLGYANSEDFYVTCISSFLNKLSLRDVIVSGASMGGQVCLAVALRAQELSVRGVIPCEACAYIPSQAGSAIYNFQGDESILHAERVCGMISPTSPEIYKRLNWWLYSSQASKIFPGDLKFYFDGWDGRDRMKLIDTEACPVYMLTGEYDYSCDVQMSRATMEEIKKGEKGGNIVFEEMQGLGHFPFSEDPVRFLPYFERALDYISKNSRNHG
jgi:pimeloyl-ACP methyl ester carboxylesterase